MESEPYHTYSYLLDRTARKVKQYAQSRFKTGNFDITVDQWLVLKNLNQHPDLNQRELAELTGKDHPTLTRIIDLLCKKKLVERCMHPADRRSFKVLITGNGRKKIADLSPKIADIRMKAWHNLTPEDYENLKRILNTIYTNLS